MGKKEEENQIELFSKNELLDISKPQQVRSYLPSAFIAAALPLRDIKKTCFLRKYNNVSLYLNGAPKVPFGVYGRLLLSILTTHAVIDTKNDNGTVRIVYENLQHLIDEMKVEKQRGKKVVEQLELFAKSTFVFEEKVKQKMNSDFFPEFQTNDSTVEATWQNYGNMPFMDGFRYLTLEDTNGNKKNIAFEVVLNEKFVRLCADHSVPIDYTVYSSIQSPLGKDLYAWIVYRNNAINNDPVHVSRTQLVEQFIPVAQGVKDQKAMERNNFNLIKERLLEIKEKYYPNLNVIFDSDGGGITLLKSNQIIKPNDQRYMLVTSNLK